MTSLISYPFRLVNDGSVATTDDGMDYYAEELVMLVKTVPGERELVPTYGIEDPTFSSFNRVELLEKVSVFGPPVTIEAKNASVLVDGRLSVSISYDEIPTTDEEEYNYNNGAGLYDEEVFINNPNYQFNIAKDF